MPEFTSHDPGSPCWVDLMTTDVNGAISFYSGLFGWDTEDQLDDDGNRIYTLCQIDGKNVTGISGPMQGIEHPMTVWNSYVTTSDANETALRATDAGGQVVLPPMQVMESGSMTAIMDPTGAVISAWQPNQHIGAELANEPNTWTWCELMTSDVDAAKDFYGQVFGWTYQANEMPNGVTYTLVEGGDNGLAGLMGRPEGIPEQVPNFWGIYFVAEDVDKTVARAMELGGSEAYAAMDVPGVGRMAGILDPQGGQFSVMSTEEG